MEQPMEPMEEWGTTHKRGFVPTVLLALLLAVLLAIIMLAPGLSKADAGTGTPAGPYNTWVMQSASTTGSVQAYTATVGTVITTGQAINLPNAITEVLTTTYGAPADSPANPDNLSILELDCGFGHSGLVWGGAVGGFSGSIDIQALVRINYPPWEYVVTFSHSPWSCPYGYAWCSWQDYMRPWGPDTELWTATLRGTGTGHISGKYCF